MGRPPAMTKIGPKKVNFVRTRGGGSKYRGLRLETGNISWGTEAVTRKCRILRVVYNAANSDYVRTNTLTKNAIVQVDATPFRQWYEQVYGVFLGKKEAQAKEEAANASALASAKAADQTKLTPGQRRVIELNSERHKRRQVAKAATRNLEAGINEQFLSGRLYVAISSRPGQSGRADGYVLEGRELDFYVKKLKSKK